MKKKITKIWGIGLVVVLVTSLLLSAVPVSASELAWGTEGIPGTTNKIVVTDIEIVDYAVSGDGQTVYAVDGATTTVYKSTDGGKTWGTKTPNVTPDLVAVAPDDPDMVVVAQSTLATGVDISTDGGSKFTQLATLGTFGAMEDIALSPDDSGYHYIGVVGDDGTDAEAWYYKLGAIGAVWTTLGSKSGFGSGILGATSPSDDAMAIAFSPSFASDKLLLAVTDNLTADKVLLEAYSFNHDAWNEDAAYEDYPATVESVSDSIGASVAFSISLAPDYEGGDPAFRIAFIGLDVTASDDSDNDGIYRMKDTTAKALKEGVDIYSVAYDGTNLVAGQNSGNGVYYSSDPLASSPSVSTTSQYKRLQGEAVIVTWAGADVLAATSSTTGTDLTGFGVSRDNGKSFSGLSMMDYGAAGLEVADLAVSADGSVIYLMTTASTQATYALWRKASDWEMVFSRAIILGNPPYVRIAPDDADTVFITENPGNSKTMFYSTQGGDTKWFLRTAKEFISEMVVESGDVLYVSEATDDNVFRSTNSGFTWGDAKSSGVDVVWMMRSLGEDTLIVGGTLGKVAYSSDGGQTWSKPHATKYPFDDGNVFVTATGVSDGDFIYCASGTAARSVVRWELGSSTSWSDIISDDLGAAEEATGIQLSSDGVLYVLAEDTVAVSSIFYRTLSPSTAGSTTGWSSENISSVALSVAPNALALSSGSTTLWSANATTNVYSYEDTVAANGPSLAGPSDGASVTVNPVSGSTFTVSFTWARLSKAEKYNLEIALDSGFNEKIINYTGPLTGDTPVIESTSSTVAKVVTGDNFMPETTYYWRVRLASDGPIYSPYSVVRSFTIGALPEAQEPVIIQQPPAPVIQVPPAPAITLQPPEIVLPAPPPAPPDIIIPAAPAPAPAIPAWALYVIIIIGAVLVIALIVLIMRTRRAV